MLKMMLKLRKVVGKKCPIFVDVCARARAWVYVAGCCCCSTVDEMYTFILMTDFSFL